MSQKENAPSFKMFRAIYKGMLDIYVPLEVENLMVNTMAEIYLEHEGNFARCNNELRNLFYGCSKSLYENLFHNAHEINNGPRLTLLWAKVHRLIFEGDVPYIALRQVCNQIERILNKMEPDHALICHQASILGLLQIWLEYNMASVCGPKPKRIQQ